MQQEIENIIKSNLPEKQLPIRGDAFRDQHCNVKGFNDCIDQINTSLIADEVLKVVVEKIEQKYENDDPQSVHEFEIFMDDIKYLLTNSSTIEGEQSEHLSPNKELCNCSDLRLDTFGEHLESCHLYNSPNKENK